MNIDKLFADKQYLNSQIVFFTKHKHIKRIRSNSELIKSHIEKAKHNLKFYKLNKNHQEFLDWLIVALYYSLYHSSLALITNKNYMSKNHYATILILIKEYSIEKEDAHLMENLAINKDDANFYTSLKKERHDASYSTQSIFRIKQIENYEKGVINFINKVEDMLDDVIYN